jgi:hypothetical protein
LLSLQATKRLTWKNLGYKEVSSGFATVKQLVVRVLSAPVCYAETAFRWQPPIFGTNGTHFVQWVRSMNVLELLVREMTEVVLQEFLPSLREGLSRTAKLDFWQGDHPSFGSAFGQLKVLLVSKLGLPVSHPARKPVYSGAAFGAHKDLHMLWMQAGEPGCIFTQPSKLGAMHTMMTCSNAFFALFLASDSKTVAPVEFPSLADAPKMESVRFVYDLYYAALHESAKDGIVLSKVPGFSAELSEKSMVAFLKAQLARVHASPMLYPDNFSSDEGSDNGWDSDTFDYQAFQAKHAKFTAAQVPVLGQLLLRV